MRKHEFCWHESRDQSPLLPSPPALNHATKRLYRLAFQRFSFTSLKKLNLKWFTQAFILFSTELDKNIINTLNTRAWMKGSIKWSEIGDYHDGDAAWYVATKTFILDAFKRFIFYVPSYAASHSGRQRALNSVQYHKQIVSVSAYLLAFQNF
jgi:hypothetical protein